MRPVPVGQGGFAKRNNVRGAVMQHGHGGVRIVEFAVGDHGHARVLLGQRRQSFVGVLECRLGRAVFGGVDEVDSGGTQRGENDFRFFSASAPPVVVVADLGLGDADSYCRVRADGLPDGTADLRGEADPVFR